MSKTIKEIMKDIQVLDAKINTLLNSVQYKEYELPNLSYDNTNADDLYMIDEINDILSKFNDVSRAVSYLKKPIIAEGTLHKGDNNRYYLQDKPLTCGYVIEYLSTDDRHLNYDNGKEVTTPYWSLSSIEHNGKDYYIVGAPELDTLEGVKVRIRG